MKSLMKKVGKLRFAGVLVGGLFMLLAVLDYLGSAEVRSLYNVSGTLLYLVISWLSTLAYMGMTLRGVKFATVPLAVGLLVGLQETVLDPSVMLIFADALIMILEAVNFFMKMPRGKSKKMDTAQG